MSVTKLPWVAVGIACVAAVIQPFVPLAVFVGLIGLSVSCSAVGLVVMERRNRRWLLEAKMEAAFGYGPGEQPSRTVADFL